MLLNSRIHELLSIWELSGCQASPEELCSQCPELIGELREHMQQLRSTERLLSSGNELPHSAPEIAGYKILSVLGAGGMGTVWRAVQLSTGRDVALKVLRSGAFASERAQRRFEREVELTARLQHPNIGRLYERGTGGGLLYFAMELIDGLPLDQYVSSRPMKKRQILTLLLITCRAVQHAHQRGVIHRDLKPSNILVTADGQPHVLDFGLAKAVLSDGMPTLSLDEVVPGTPSFMSPEQAAGDAERVDVRCDVFSLGVILFRLLLNAWPHRQAENYVRLMRHIADEPARRARNVDPSIDADLDALLAHALAHKLEERYASADQLADDISRYLAGDPLLYARRQTAAYRLTKTLIKYRWRMALAASVLVALGGIIIAAYVQNTRQRHRAETAVAIASAVDQFMQHMFAQVTPAHAQGREPLVREVLDRAAQEVGNHFSDQPLVEAAVRNSIGRSYASLSRVKDAEEQLKPALKIRQAIQGESDPQTLQAAQDLAFLYESAFRLDEAEALTRRTLELRRRTLGVNHPDTLESLQRLGNVFASKEQYSDARPLFQEAYDRRLVLLGESHADTLWSMNDLACMLARTGSFEEGISLMRRCFTLRADKFGPKHPDTLNSELNLAGMLMRVHPVENLDESSRLMEHNLTLRREVFPKGSTDVALACHSLGGIRRLQHRLPDAEALLREAYLTRAAVRGETSDEAKDSRAALIAVLREEGKPENIDAIPRASPPSH